MDFEGFICALKQEKIEYVLNEPMKNHTSFKIGGNADIFITVKSTEELKSVLLKLKNYEIPYFVLGKGSNILVSDDGIEGAVISLSGLVLTEVSGNIITCSAGLSLSCLCRTALENSLSGLEFAYGIPGSVGGALFMNAGAYGGEIKDVVLSAEYMDSDGEIKSISSENMALGYRTSIFKGGQKIITKVTFKLNNSEKCKIEEKMNELIGKRKSKQPLEYPSAGSTFKRPDGYFAGGLIEKNCLKGVTVGGAMVSEKHAGFVINYNNATCKDVVDLIENIRKTVLESDGVCLEPEVIKVGRGS